MSESTYEDLPPPPDGLHGGEESMNMTSPNNQGHSTSRALVSPRPIKNHVHDIQVCKAKFKTTLLVCSAYYISCMYVLNKGKYMYYTRTYKFGEPSK